MSAIEKVMNELRNMGRPQRKEFLAAMGKEFCTECAKDDPNCQCWMDD